MQDNHLSSERLMPAIPYLWLPLALGWLLWAASCRGDSRALLATGAVAALLTAAWQVRVTRVNVRLREEKRRADEARELSLQGVNRGAAEQKLARDALKEKTEELDRFFTVALDLFCIAGTDGVFRRLNPQWETVLGYSLPELIGRRFLDLVHPEDQAATLAAVAELAGQKAVLNFVNRYRCKNGSYRWLEWRSTPAGEVIYAAARDITGHKQAEAALEHERQFTQAVLDSVPGLLYLYDHQGRLVRWNKQHETLTGYSAEELGRMTLMDWYRGEPEEAARIAAAVQRIPRDGHAVEEANLVTKDGQRIRFYFTAVALRIDNQDYFVGIGIDVTERRRAEEALRQSEANLQLALDAARMGDWSWNVVTGEVAWSTRCKALYGLPPDTVVTYERFLQCLHPEDRERIAAVLRRAVEQRTDYEVEKRAIWPDGSLHWNSTRGRVFCDPAGRPVRVVGVTLDITERKEAERALRLTQYSIDQASHAVYWMDRDAGFSYVNDQACGSLGYTREELLQLHLWDVDPFFPRDLWFARWEGYQRDRRGGIEHLESIHQRKDGTRFPVEVVSKHLWLGEQELHVAFVLDITERKRAEEALRASLDEKIALLKEVHHRVKNNLQIVSSLLSLQAARVQNPLALTALRDTQNRVHSMSLIHETLYRSGNLAQVNFTAYIENLCAHLFHAFGANTAHIELAIDVTGVALELDEAVPCGLIVNELVSNALKYAFPDGRAGRITVSLRNSADNLRTLRLADNGIGLPAGLDVPHTDTLGLRLVTNLSDQLGATFEVLRAGGTAFVLTFRGPTPPARA